MPVALPLPRMLLGRILRQMQYMAASRRHSGSLIAKGFTKIVSPTYGSSTGAIPGDVTSSPSLPSAGLGTAGLDTS